MRMRAYSAPCRMGAYAPVWGEGARTGPSWSEFAPKDWKPAQISNHASIMRPMRMRPTRIRHPQRMAEIRMALLSRKAARKYCGCIALLSQARRASPSWLEPEPTPEPEPEAEGEISAGQRVLRPVTAPRFTISGYQYVV